MRANRSAPELMVRTLKIVVFLLAASGFAAAGTTSATCTSINQPTDLANATISCSQFPPATGELTGISITISGAINGSINLTNNSTTTTEVATGTTSTVFSLNAALPGFSFPGTLFSGSFTTGSQSLAPGATYKSGTLTSGPLNVGPLTDNTNSTFAGYEGAGTFTLGFNTVTTDPDTGGGGNVSTVHVTSATVSVVVVYTFTTPPALTCASTGTTGEVGVAFSSPALSVLGGVPPFTFSVASGALPNGLTLNTSTGAVTGTPTAAGSWTLQVTDSNGVLGTPTCPYSIGQITPTCPATGTTGKVGTAFSSPAITVTGGTPPYTFSVVGTIAPGLTLNTGTGAITGTPTAPGSWSVQVTDSKGGVGSLTCPFSVSGNLTLTCASSGAFGTVGQVFSSPALTPTGGTPPYTFSILGTLAPGLTLNTSTGAITGTPTATGSWSVEVTDSTGLVSSNSCPYGVALADQCPAPAFQVHYASNLNVGESYIDIANPGTDGAPLMGPGYGAAAGNVCVNVYAFDPTEEMLSCCSCLVTPDQTVNLGVNRDLLVKTLTGEVPTSVTVKLVATLAGAGGMGTTCTNSAATVGSSPPACGLLAWGTTLHATPTAGAYNTTETPFTPSTLSAAEIASLTNRCANILGNGSGFGLCNSCRAGALGAAAIAH
jgi:Putative Ig domain